MGIFKVGKHSNNQNSVQKGGELLQLEIIIQHCNLEAEPGNSSRAAVNRKKP